MTTAVSRPGAPRPVTPLTILATRLDQLAQRAGDAPGADPSFAAELRDACELARGLDPYLSRWTTPESAALRRLSQRTHAEDWTRHPAAGLPAPLEQEMLSGHVEGQTLKMLVHAIRARRVLEIGMFTGYSALAMAEALPADGQLISCELDAEVAALAQACFADSASGRKITVKVGPAQETLTELASARYVFDLVFIDADKPGYGRYLDTLLGTGLVAPHGLICVDNTLLQGEPWLPGQPTANGTAVAAFNQQVAADPRVEQVILPLRDGLTLIRQVDADQVGEL
jgi:caffeoyl-CoA O-methyltransferase